MTLRHFLLFCVLCSVTCSANAKFKCPDYSTIMQPSMENFDIKEYQGLWYEVATNEPTLPHDCDCQTLTWKITSETTFSDTFYADCIERKKNITLPLKGKLSLNPTEAGNLREEGVPNMIYNVTRDPTSGKLLSAHVYSCVSDLFSLFSFQLLYRTPVVPMEEIEAAVAAGKAIGLQMHDVRITNMTACPWNSKK
jgi:hypothetical protein